MIKVVCKKYFFLLFLLLNLFCYSQKKSSTIDRWLSLSDSYINKDFKKSLSFAEKAIVESEKQNDSEKKARAYFYAAKSLVFFRDFERSSTYIEKGLKENTLKNDTKLKALFLMLQGGYYSRMSLFDQSFRTLKEALSLLIPRDDLESKLMISSTYIYLSDYYTEIKDYKSAHVYADKSIRGIESISQQQYLSSKRIYRNKAFIYFYKSWIFLEQENPRAAFPFIQKAYDQALLERIDYLALFHEIYGDYYFQIYDYRKAIDFYKKAIENKKKFGQNSAYVDSKIAKSYKALSDSDNEKHYLAKAENRRQIDQEENNLIIHKELDKILEKEEIKRNDLKFKNNFIITIIITFFVIVLIIVVIRYKKIRRKKRRIIGEQKNLLLEKESEISERNFKIGKLEQKVSDSFSELTDMVKQNSPHFWGRFQELHPDFCTKMLKINPKLKNTELIFSAYIYLGFANKEIAEYTFKAIRTIENNRYNLRKKVGLKTDEDFAVWLKKHVDNA